MRIRPIARLLPAIVASLLAVVAVPAVACAQSAPTVKTQTGDVQGIAEHGVVAFKGIPYAAPPVGDLRWRAPKPAAAWQGVRSGGTFGRGCIAKPGIPTGLGGDPGPHSEDCLFLNVWTPKADRSAGLPVMVWIHGGAYVFGSGSVDLYSGAPLARRGAVVVTINYRLLQLGFFAHPALEKEAPGGPANFGLLDQIAALAWVQQNIAAFGGNPENVTIFGQSAGAKSVLALVASPLARGLFHKGIAHSSYILPDNSRAKAVEIGIKVSQALGVSAAATAADLRAVPAGKFAALEGQGLSNAPVPIAGDPVLPQSIQATFAAGREAPVPLMLGDTSDDTSVVAAFGVDPAAVLKRLGAAGFLVRALYPGVRDDSELARQATRDVVFTMPVRWIADRHAALAPTFRFYFDYVTLNDRGKYPNGVAHGGDVPYALDTLALFSATKDIATDQDRALARRVGDYWFQFARTGRPSAPGAPAWPNHTRRQDRTMIFAGKTEVRSNFMRPRLNVLIGVARIAGAILDRK
jgi:para-nitrobenzyl esterase